VPAFAAPIATEQAQLAIFGLGEAISTDGLGEAISTERGIGRSAHQTAYGLRPTAYTERALIDVPDCGFSSQSDTSITTSIMRDAPQGPADAPPMPEPHLITTEPHLNTTKPHLNTTKPHLNTTKPHLITTKPHLITTKPHLNATQPHHSQANRPTRLLGGQPAEERLLAGDNLRRRAVLVVLVGE
jgi:hypothetical protein